MAIVPYVPPRAYTDLAHTDHSQYLRANVRSLQRKGEQLWDSDINNNLSYWKIWNPMNVIYRRDQKTNQRPPFYSPTVQKYIIDPKYATVPPDGEDLIYFYSRGMLQPLYYKPLNGQFAWVKADRMLVAYTQGEWRGVARQDTKDANVEIAVYVKGIKKAGRPFVATHVVGQPFQLRPTSYSRARGIDMGGAIPITRNGVVVGSIYKQQFSSGVAVAGPIQFNKGDVLGFQIPAGSIGDEVYFTIMGALV